MSEDETPRTEDRPEPAGPVGEAAPSVVEASGSTAHAGLRLLAAAVTLPWLVAYGVLGTSAVTRAAQSAAAGLKRVDAGYTRFVTPGELAFVGGLLLAAFGTLLACALLLAFRSRSTTTWLAVLLAAAGLTAGSVWASVRGDLHPMLWVLFFFGLAYCTAVAALRVVQMTRAERRGRIAPP